MSDFPLLVKTGVFRAFLTLFFSLLLMELWAARPAAAQVMADFKASESTGCGQLSVHFTDQSTGNPSSWKWDFGDGTGAEGTPEAAKTFTVPGTYPVQLIVSNGVSSDTAIQYITVYEPPKVQFSLTPNAGCYPLEVQFTDQSDPGTGDITSWNWDYGDGSPFGTTQNPTHTYNSAGTFTAKLTVTNSAGCTTSSSNKQVVTNEGVTVDFKADKTFSCGPYTAHFTATASNTDQAVTYHWDFGDGGTATGDNPAYTFNQPGVYTVTLTAAVGGGQCRNEVVKQDYIRVDRFVPDFEVPQGCAKVDLKFHNTSKPLPTSSTWTFSDGTTLDGVDVTHQFAQAGTYQVTLTNDYGGCTSTVTKTITTYSSPVADFKTDLQNYCGIPASVAFQNLSQNGATWKWRFGDGDSSTSKIPTHSYADAGTYNVFLLAVSADGCRDSVTKPAYIHVEAPNIAFNADPGFGCLPLKTTFKLPAGSAAAIQTYHWNFGDGTTSDAASPTHTYTTAGSFDVTLDVVTKSGCKFTFTRKDYIHTGTKPHANFSADPLQACLNTPVQFTNLSSPANLVWTWSFPNDKNANDTARNPVHKFGTLGSQDVILVANNNGCMDTMIRRAYVDVNPPKAMFDWTVVDCADPFTIRFNSEQSEQADTYLWDFGDGQTSTQANPRHTFATAGAKKVTLTVYNGECSDSHIIYVQIVNETPRLSLSSPAICRDGTVTLQVNDIQITPFVSNLIFHSGDGREEKKGRNADNSLPTYSFRYTANGSFRPFVIVNYVTGCADTVYADLTVRGPMAEMTASALEICQGKQVSFTDHSQPDPANAAIRQWIWTYGDGETDTTSTGSVIHTYSKDGQYGARLKVIDANGCSDITPASTHRVIVHPSKADFATPDTLSCPGHEIHWENNSLGQGPGTSYLWNFGDGQTSTEQVPAGFQYPGEGTYTVKLKITTNQGCIDSLTRTDYIKVGAPKAIMKHPEDVKICRIFQDTAISLSQNYRSVLWDFGDGTTSTRDTAYHTYNIPGTYTQRLTVYGYSDDCTATVERTIIIAGPTGTPVLDITGGCAPLRVNFSAKDVKRAVTYQWFFGDGRASAVSGGDQASYTYTNKGLFHPTLKLTDDTGCYVIVPFNDTLNVVVDSVGVEPVTSWPEPCDSNQIAFDMQGTIFSADSLGKPATFHWDFGDPTMMDDVSADPRPTYRYPAAGHYEGTLRVTTAYGCDQSVPFSVNIPDSVALQATASADPAEICVGNPVSLHASSNIGATYSWLPAADLDDPHSTDPVARPLANTTYQVVVTDAHQCQVDTAAVQVTVHDLPQVDAGPDIVVATGSVLNLQAKGSADVTRWNWAPPDYLSCTDCANPTSTPRENMQYILTGTNQFGCQASDTMQVHLVCDEGKVFIPNTFTPNGDGQNDQFYPRGAGVKLVRYFRIYNRLGQLVYERTNFQLNDKAQGWDGTFKGQKLNPDVFVFSTSMICDNNEVFELSGNISLVR
jgi:gliding motility-associated-like protein